jgi:hypothetical protein
MQHGFYRAQWGQSFTYFAADLEITDFDDPTVPPNTTYDLDASPESHLQLVKLADGKGVSPADVWAFNLGEDIGCGYGWKLQFGSLTPYWASGYYGGIDQYLFVDSTGAEYHLNQNFQSIWYSTESIYVAEKNRHRSDVVLTFQSPSRRGQRHNHVPNASRVMSRK